MKYEEKPETLEGDWDRFYLEYPDVYDRFALTSASSVAAMGEMFDLDGKCIVDVGSGTGRSTFELAKHARFVVGLEPWDPMREFSVRKARSMGIQNVAFVNGFAEELPFGDNSADHIVSVYSFPFWFVDAGQEGQFAGKAVCSRCVENCESRWLHHHRGERAFLGCRGADPHSPVAG